MNSLAIERINQIILSLTRSIRILGYIGAGSLGVCVSLIGIQEPGLAQVCNVFGCSQPGAGACNPFGCPNPGAGECTPFGCPASPPTNSNNPNQSTSNNSSRSFTITNNTNQAIQALFLSPSAESSWGTNDINSNLFSGNSVTFQLTGDCRWDLQIQLSNSQTIQEKGIDTCLNSSYSVGSGNSQVNNSNQLQGLTLRPTATAGSYWVYQKPANISDSQMQSAGAGFYSSPQACSMHYSLCTTLGGVWLSQQESLVIQNSQTPPANLPTQNGSGYPPTPLPPVNSPRSETELYLDYYRECMDRSMYRTFRAYDQAIAVNGYNMGYQYGRKPSDLSDEQMKAAGLNWDWTFQSWIGSQPEIKILIMESAQASQLCRNELENVRSQ